MSSGRQRVGFQPVVPLPAQPRIEAPGVDETHVPLFSCMQSRASSQSDHEHATQLSRKSYPWFRFMFLVPRQPNFLASRVERQRSSREINRDELARMRGVMAGKGPLLRVQSIDQSKVYDPLGVCVGELEGMLVDPLLGRVKYALVSFNFASIQHEQLTLPWEIMRWRRAPPGFHCYATETQLRSVPRVDTASLDQSVDRKLRKHFAL
jgi:hypothetical protein